MTLIQLIQLIQLMTFITLLTLMTLMSLILAHQCIQKFQLRMLVTLPLQDYSEKIERTSQNWHTSSTRSTFTHCLKYFHPTLSPDIYLKNGETFSTSTNITDIHIQMQAH